MAPSATPTTQSAAAPRLTSCVIKLCEKVVCERVVCDLRERVACERVACERVVCVCVQSCV